MLRTQLVIAGALLAAEPALPAERSAAVQTRSCTLTLSNAVVVGFSNRLSGECLVKPMGSEAEWSGLQRLNESALRGAQARWQANPNSTTAVQLAAQWEKPDHSIAGEMTMRLETEPATGDVLVTQHGNLATN